MDNSLDPESVESVEMSHFWLLVDHQEYGRGIGGMMVTLRCTRCGTEKTILMIQKAGAEISQEHGALLS